MKPVVKISGSQLTFYCPGCKNLHSIPVSINGGSGWAWNGNLVKPTITPSILVRGGHYTDRHQPGDPCWCTFNQEHPEDPVSFTCQRCHSFVTDGQIIFLDDCSHELKGQTVSLLPKEMEAS